MLSARAQLKQESEIPQVIKEWLGYFPGGYLKLTQLIDKDKVDDLLKKGIKQLINHISFDPRFSSLIIEWRNSLKRISYKTQDTVDLIALLTLCSKEIKHIAVVSNLKLVDQAKNRDFFLNTLPDLIEKSFVQCNVSVFSFAYFDANSSLEGSKQEVLQALEEMIQSLGKLLEMADQYKFQIFRIGSVDCKHADIDISNKLNEFYTRLTTCEKRTHHYKNYRLNLAVNFKAIDPNFAARFNPLGSHGHFKRLQASSYAAAAPDLMIQCNAEEKQTVGHNLFDSATLAVPLKDVSVYELHSDHLMRAANQFTQELAPVLRASL